MPVACSVNWPLDGCILTNQAKLICAQAENKIVLLDLHRTLMDRELR